MILEEKIYLWLLLLIPVVILLYLIFRLWQKRARSKFAKPELLSFLTPNRSSFKPFLKLSLILLALASLIFGLVNPKVGSQLETVKREGVDIVFAVDVSKSMEAEDIAPNRLEKAKQIITKVIENLGSDRIGIIIYAGSSYPLLPITTDYAAAKMFLQNANTDMVSNQGTAINDAIERALSYYDNDDQTNRFLVIVSDGEDHQENTLELAKEAAKKGIKIYTVGIGTAKGGPIPIKDNGRVVAYKKNNEGTVVVTQMNEQILRDLASTGNGKYINGNRTQETISTIKEVLENAEKSEFETKQFSDYKDQFQWFVGIGLLLLIIDVTLLEKKTKWVQKLNLFNEK